MHAVVACRCCMPPAPTVGVCRRRALLLHAADTPSVPVVGACRCCPPSAPVVGAYRCCPPSAPVVSACRCCTRSSPAHSFQHTYAYSSARQQVNHGDFHAFHALVAFSSTITISCWNNTQVHELTGLMSLNSTHLAKILAISRTLVQFSNMKIAACKNMAQVRKILQEYASSAKCAPSATIHWAQPRARNTTCTPKTLYRGNAYRALDNSRFISLAARREIRIPTRDTSVISTE